MSRILPNVAIVSLFDCHTDSKSREYLRLPAGDAVGRRGNSALAA